MSSVSVSQDNTHRCEYLANPSLTITQGQSTTLTAQRQCRHSPFGATGSKIQVTSAIVVSAAGPYSVTGTAANGCSGTASVTLTVNPVVSLPFAITGVTTVSCTPILPNRFSLSFDPRYDGLDGQPFSFSVTNELFPTTDPGPYTLQLYTDNPVITLEAAQRGVTTRYIYNWLEACRTTTTPNTPPRVVMWHSQPDGYSGSALQLRDSGVVPSPTTRRRPACGCRPRGYHRAELFGSYPVGYALNYGGFPVLGDHHGDRSGESIREYHVYS